MSGSSAPRLRPVDTTEGVDRSERDENATDAFPQDLLRLAALPQERRLLLLQVSDFLEEIDFGTVVVVMHDGKVAQIETSEKIRLR